MPNGYFNLSGFDKMGPDDILKANINESGEFAPQSYAQTGADNGVPDPKVPTPAPQKETLADGEKGPSVPQSTSMPGETEVKKPQGGGEMGPKIPQGTELTLDEWKAAMRGLQHSFKEGMELMQMLESCRIVEKTMEQQQQEYMESYMAEAYYESMLSGPMFEAVKRSDKDDVKKVVKKIRGTISKWCDDNDVKFRRCGTYEKIFNMQWFITRLWQVPGVVYIESGNINSVVKELNKLLAEELGDYKLIPANFWVPDIIDLFKVKFNWKNQKSIYMLVVDKKLPYEFTKEGQQADSETALAGKKPGKKGKDGDAVTESGCNSDECDEGEKKPDEEKKGKEEPKDDGKKEEEPKKD